MHQSFLLLLLCLIVPFASAGINHFHFCADALNDVECIPSISWINIIVLVFFKFRSFQNPFAYYESAGVVFCQREKQRQQNAKQPFGKCSRLCGLFQYDRRLQTLLQPGSCSIVCSYSVVTGLRWNLFHSHCSAKKGNLSIR